MRCKCKHGCEPSIGLWHCHKQPPHKTVDVLNQSEVNPIDDRAYCREHWRELQPESKTAVSILRAGDALMESTVNMEVVADFLTDATYYWCREPDDGEVVEGYDFDDDDMLDAFDEELSRAKHVLARVEEAYARVKNP